MKTPLMIEMALGTQFETLAQPSSIPARFYIQEIVGDGTVVLHRETATGMSRVLFPMEEFARQVSRGVILVTSMDGSLEVHHIGKVGNGISSRPYYWQNAFVPRKQWLP